MMKMSIFFFYSLLFLASFAHVLRADIAEYDDVWLKRREEAMKAALDAYHPNPEEVTTNLNHHVNLALEGSNSTRRNLGKYVGRCSATNPIDRCWRCQRNWARNRKRLADCALGFGRKTIGGKDGSFYVVTDSSDTDMVNPKPGTLRHAVIQEEPLWIIFARDMVIRLNQELIMTSDKTIDGRGSRVYIIGGAGLTLQFIKNVIIHGLHIHHIVQGNGGLIRDSVSHFGQRTQSDGDAISIFGSSHIWIDHNSLSHCTDGLIDVIQGSTAITISNNHMTDHDDVMLFGSSDAFEGDKVMQITVAFNHFGQGLTQRMPRCRWGFFHIVNNDYTHWKMYAIGGSQHPTIVSQGNRFIAPDDIRLKEVTKREAGMDVWKDWNWSSEGDLLMNGAFFVKSGTPSGSSQFPRHYMIKAKPGSFVRRLTRFAGALSCKRGHPC
ncbi:hypothetical protein Syun_023757 [Stephania yunnanensis]|uniref:Pectate lyase n=1 Tax=Stephania yunnanensis TaxID=152371 RepID=A0AAP0I3I0_9MAGN